ncbi:glycogen phosphorylase 1 [Heterostelium album PN500]|uniref:Alpha-1,4 glucan phosphorylase n=1 Tax=Heterostelium pallidum (strain ATCC 26659 / Pp 5 / PN500) TaxID=670386 RepID=D3AYA7_HETP5|nr:glycogen phosphorylase 1 [Heterostelium album PN500]EFA85934.1 glycogen phosphorylase 1 [Heterostelium album PN500]|eukprot:XP_020438040.1 glycogen phosphorylase 1 [Heterostelium album PN500]
MMSIPFKQTARTTTGVVPPTEKKKGSKLFALKTDFLKNDEDSIQKGILDHVEYTLARTKYNFDSFSAYQGSAYSVRDRLIERWNETQQYYTEKDPKRVYYLSMEFLMGRTLQNAIYNMGLNDEYHNALLELGFELEDLYEEEKDAALGNGGLGRLAACFMDSLATLKYPAWGYGLRYNYGMFEQGIYDGYQTEVPDYWLVAGNPWEIERLDVQYTVRFYGHVVERKTSEGVKFEWEGGELVQAIAYDTPVPGYHTTNTNNIRLWSSKPHKEFDLDAFNGGNYLSAVEAKQRSENITSVLYPNDNTYSGKELRLKQQYFFIAATLCDVVRRYKKTHTGWKDFSSKVAIQLNDTHPTIGIVELFRKLLDEEHLQWDEAWSIVTKTFGYTNHTILPEALEMWPVQLIEDLLPRHMQLIYGINHRFLITVTQKWPGNIDKMRNLSIIQEGDEKKVRMAHLAIVGSRFVNGVAAMHSELVKHRVFPDFFALFPEKFQNKTNGVTPRRWIQQANPGLSQILTKWLGSERWAIDLEMIKDIQKHINNPELIEEWKSVKQFNKERLADFIHKNCGVKVNTNALFDVHIKRIHEYKRQLLNILGVIYRYLSIKKMSVEERQSVVPRVVIFAGKAAPGYFMAKRHIKLINSVAEVINNDKEVEEYLKVVFIANYNVSVAQVIIPASDINQQISTAGTEASGTSNMKFTMNGSLIIGTLDGANVEIAEEVGEENMFIFGLRTHEIDKAREKMKAKEVVIDSRLQEVFLNIELGTFGPPEIFKPIVDSLVYNDFYLTMQDFPLYLEAQEEVDALWKKQDEWIRKSIINTANTYFFSSDRAMREYADQIWDIKPCEVETTENRRY